jgi:hypothetical protein
MKMLDKIRKSTFKKQETLLKDVKLSLVQVGLLKKIPKQRNVPQSKLLAHHIKIYPY